MPTSVRSSDEIRRQIETIIQSNGNVLESREKWKVETSGATLRFATDVKDVFARYGIEGFVPAFIAENPNVADAGAHKLNDLMEPLLVEMKGIRTLAQLQLFLDRVCGFSESSQGEELKAFFAANDVETIRGILDQAGIVYNQNENDASKLLSEHSKLLQNRIYMVQEQRREALFKLLSDNISKTRLSNYSFLDETTQSRAKGLLALYKDKMMMNKSYNMMTGSHTNYWPYSNNYLPPLEKLLEQCDKTSPEYQVIRARIQDIYNHKTVQNGSSVDEKNLESSTGMLVVHHPIGSDNYGYGHRVSVTSDDPLNPAYSLFSIKENVASFAEYAGAKIYKDGEKYYFDYDENHLDRVGKEVPAELAKVENFVTKTLSSDEWKDLGLRPPEANERVRSNIPFDWDGDVTINIRITSIGWWGHCHIEAPANCNGIDPQTAVNFYNAKHASVEKVSPFKEYSAEDIWDIVGAFLTADETQAYKGLDNGNPQVNKTSFVGDRNNGSHFLEMNVNGLGHSVRLDCEVTGIWSIPNPTGSDPNDMVEKKYDNPMSRFKSNLEKDDGTFEKNPKASNVQGDVITVDCNKRHLEVKVKYMDYDRSTAQPHEKEEYVTLDPSKDEFVKIGAEQRTRPTWEGGTINEIWYNPKTGEAKWKEVTIKKEHGVVKVEGDVDLSTITPQKVTLFNMKQETTYDSVIDIHSFITHKLGLPFVFDTSPGMSVWNYPVNSLTPAITKTVYVDKNGKVLNPDGSSLSSSKMHQVKFSYTSYSVSYTSMGGPNGTFEYVLKRNPRGDIIDACALTPMPDFAFREEKTVSTLVGIDDNGQPYYNPGAVSLGFGALFEGDSIKSLDASMWEDAGTILFASLMGKGNVAKLDDGRIVTFDDSAKFGEFTALLDELYGKTTPVDSAHPSSGNPPVYDVGADGAVG